MKHISSQTSTYLGNIMLPGKTFMGAINVKNNVPVKTTKKVSVVHTSKKLSAGNDIFTNHENKFKQEELSILFKSSNKITKFLDALKNIALFSKKFN